jgi:hypothetical protein
MRYLWSTDDGPAYVFGQAEIKNARKKFLNNLRGKPHYCFLTGDQKILKCVGGPQFRLNTSYDSLCYHTHFSRDNAPLMTIFSPLLVSLYPLHPLPQSIPSS